MREQLRALLQELRSRHDLLSDDLLSDDAGVLAVFPLGDDAAVVDLNSAFTASARAENERLLVQAMTETLAANQPAIHRVKFLVDGEECGPLPGHLDLRVWFLAMPSDPSRSK